MSKRHNADMKAILATIRYMAVCARNLSPGTRLSKIQVSLDVSLPGRRMYHTFAAVT
jgi:hypothetical protein